MSEILQTVFRHDPSIVSRHIAGETILVPIRKNMGDMESIYTLNETASRVWELIDGKHTLEQITGLLVAEFDVDAVEAANDLAELVESLQNIGAISTE